MNQPNDLPYDTPADALDSTNGFKRPPTPEELGALIALASVEMLGPATMLRCLREVGVEEAFHTLQDGRIDDLEILQVALMPKKQDKLKTHRRDDPDRRTRAIRIARQLDPAKLFAQHSRGGRQIFMADRLGYPWRLARFPSPPPLILATGDLGILDNRTVAVVGTRNATQVGRDFAVSLGRGLSAAGVSVVSGLALGIDASAHRGALQALRSDVDGETCAAPPVGVIASGLDVAYPRRNLELHRQVEASGALFSETPLGHRPSEWRFPARNRIIARLSDAVVVVESRHKGGSMNTAEHALRLGVALFAVPGHPLAPASTGTNQLIFDGANMARDVEDILCHLGLTASRPVSTDDQSSATASVEVASNGEAIIQALAAGAAALGELVLATGQDMDALAVELMRLQGQGLVIDSAGWFELGARGIALVTEKKS